MDPPPPYKEQASMSRSRNARGTVAESAEALLRSSVSNNATAPTLQPPSTASNPTSPASPPSSSGSRRSSAASPAVSPRAPYLPFVAPPPRRPSWGSSKESSPTSARGGMFLNITGPTPRRASQSSTEERLREAERERDELRRNLEGERALVDRLKRESGRPAYVAKKDAKQRVSQLKDEARTAAAEASKQRAAGIFKEACSTDLLFLIDSTLSMQRHIDNVKKQVKDIVTDITTAFFNDATVRIAVVAYRDHCATPNIEWIDFTTDTKAIFTFLDKVKADSGDDWPEDVLGGINQALNASWKQGTRCVVHIADAPPHGRIFPNDGDNRRDDYPEPGSEPHGLTYQPLLTKMAELNINYALFPINNTTDRMAYLFAKVYTQLGADAKLHTANKYYYSSDISSQGQNSQLGRISKRSAQGRLLFMEAEMGKIHDCLRRLVVKTVLSSAPRTATRTAERGTQQGSTMAEKTLAAIDEDGRDPKDVEFDTEPPKWDTLGWLDETIAMDGFSPDVVIHSAKTLDNMMQHDDNIKMSVTELTIQKRSQPFAEGAMRLAAYARTASSSNPFVVKSFKRSGKGLAYLAEDMRCQALCKAFALEFNALAGEKNSLDFIVTTCLRGKVDAVENLSMEPFIPGAYVKYNNNCGYVNEEIGDDRTNKAAQAFSHFTFERSRGRFLVSDLQGVGNVLTDPAIHTLDPERFKLADTNLGEDGFKFFFATHQCNDICRTLGLKSTAAMLLAHKFDFRERWGDVGSTVCCSNKFCGKIVRVATAHNVLKYPGFYWCDTCYPQLDKSMGRWLCLAPGPNHTFQASQFFYESQGRLTPRTCPTHRVRDETVPRPTSEGGNFWSKIGFGKGHKSRPSQ